MREPGEKDTRNPERESPGDQQRRQGVPFAVALGDAVRAEHQGQEWTYQCDGPCKGRQETASPRPQERHGSGGCKEECEDSCRDLSLGHSQSFQRNSFLRRIPATTASRTESQRPCHPRRRLAICAGRTWTRSHRPRRPARMKPLPRALQGPCPGRVRLACGNAQMRRQPHRRSGTSLRPVCRISWSASVRRSALTRIELFLAFREAAKRSLTRLKAVLRTGSISSAAYTPPGGSRRSCRSNPGAESRTCGWCPGGT